VEIKNKLYFYIFETTQWEQNIEHVNLFCEKGFIIGKVSTMDKIMQIHAVSKFFFLTLKG
jgi:hypothetical protein